MTGFRSDARLAAAEAAAKAAAAEAAAKAAAQQPTLPTSRNPNAVFSSDLAAPRYLEELARERKAAAEKKHTPEEPVNRGNGSFGCQI